MSSCSNIIGALFGLGATVAFSTNDVGIKFLSSGYPLHEVVFIRSLVGVTVFLFLFMPFSGGLKVIHTRHLWLLTLRGLCAVVANLSFFLGLAALPIAEAVAIFFVSPMIITVFSVILLGETVGVRRWSAIVIGLIGVLIVIRPGTSAFQIASLLPIFAAIGYGYLHIITRQLREYESAATMTFYTLVVFIITSAVIGLILGHGYFDGFGHPSLQFLLRAWEIPDPSDFLIFGIIGFFSVVGGFLISQAYRLSEAAFVAPMEYIAMPLAIFWGVVFFDEWPDAIAWLGIAIILGSGLYMVIREAQIGKEKRFRP